MPSLRASWKGQLRISLVSFPVCLYNAVSGASRISMNQLHRDCNRRLRQQMICPEHGPVERSDIVKGYEYEKDKYVLIEESDLEKVRIETTHTIDLANFIDAASVPDLYFESPYYVAPDGPVAEEAFRVVREAMRRAGKLAIGRVVLSGREHMVALRVQDKGFVMTTLRTAEEVRQPQPYFESIRDEPVSDEQMKLAEMLIESKTATFDPAQFRDRYQDGLLEIIKAKVAGSEPVVTQLEEVGQVINLMDALKASLAELPQKKPAAASVKAPAARAKRARKSG